MTTGKMDKLHLKLTLSFTLVFICQIIGKAEETHFTPVPLVDINKDLRPLFFGSQSDYFISTYEADAATARQVCQNLTDLTGKRFQLLVVENDQEANELQPYLESLQTTGIWTAGKKSFNDQGVITVFWSTTDGSQSMAFKNFRQGLSIRRRRDAEDNAGEGIEVVSANSVISTLYPWLNVGRAGIGGKCRSGTYTPPDCEPIQCNITMPDCSTITPPCQVCNQTECSVTRPPCSAKCENCTVVAPVCYAQAKACTVTTEECQTIRQPCNVTTPDCTTTRPPCQTIQPPCDVVIPPPCTTRPPCIPSFKKDNCTTKTFPCKTNSKNETICPEPKTTCEPSYKCPPPEVCQSPAIICPPPLIYCEPEQTVCPDPIIHCPKPAIYCPPPKVDCPEPEVVCTRPQVICSSPVVNCPGIVTSCPAPGLQCPKPIVDCPPPIVNCTEPEPCKPPVATPPPCTPEPTTTTTTPPCGGCGCVAMIKKHEFKWDIKTCGEKHHFICEG